MTTMSRRTVRYGGAQMRVRDLVGDHDRTFVMIHGIGVSSKYFERLAGRLHEHGNVLLLDLPGFGGVRRPDHPLTIEAFADIVLAGMTSEGLTNPVLIGHSMGAQIVTSLLAEHDLSTHAVLIGPPVNPAEPGAFQQAIRLVQSARYESRTMLRIVSRAYLVCHPRWILDVMPSMLGFDMRAELAKVRARTVAVRGEHDYCAPAVWTEEVVEILPDGVGVQIPGAGHGVVYDYSDELADLIIDHLREGATRPDAESDAG